MIASFFTSAQRPWVLGLASVAVTFVTTVWFAMCFTAREGAWWNSPLWFLVFYAAAVVLALRGIRSFRNPGAGVESLHVAIDDHSRFAFACLLPDESSQSVLHALHLALSFYSAHGFSIQQLLTDRGPTYRSKIFAASCHKLGLTHLFTKPYRPQTNGKAERFIQTITREWAYARSYNSSTHRATFLPYYLHGTSSV